MQSRVVLDIPRVWRKTMMAMLPWRGGSGATGGPLSSNDDSKTTCHGKAIQESVTKNFHVGKSRCQKEAADPSSSCRPCMVARGNCPRRVERTP